MYEKPSQGSSRDITHITGLMYVSDSACSVENGQGEEVR